MTRYRRAAAERGVDLRCYTARHDPAALCLLPGTLANHPSE